MSDHFCNQNITSSPPVDLGQPWPLPLEVTFSKLAVNQGLTRRVLLPKPAMELLVLGLRNIRLLGLYYPPAWMGAKQ